MSFVTTHPEALAAAANNLQAITSALAAQNAAGAAPTTGVIPAAADEVSALQATQFAAYGKLYQQVSAQATAIQEMFVQTLRTSADSYNATEAANSAAANSAQAGGFDALGGLSTAGLTQLSNFGSAGSDLLQLGSAGFLAPGALAGGGQGATAAGAAAMLTSTAGPATPAAAGAAPVLVSTGRAASLKGLSVPPSWVGAAEAASSATPAPMRTAGWTAAAPHSAPVATMPAGMPSVASAEQGGFRFGAPRYGVKPKVMPQPAFV